MLLRMNTAQLTSEILALAGWTQTRLGEEIGVSQPTVARWVKGADPEGPSRDRLRQLHARLFPRKPPLISTFDPDKPDDSDTDPQMTAGAETGVQGIPADASPQLDVTAGMGAGGITIIAEGVPGRRGMTFAAEHISDYWRLPAAVLASMGGVRPTDVTFIPVQGDSMWPTLVEGDVVVVDTRHRLPSPDGVYALTDAFGGIVVKRLEVTSRPGDEEPMVDVISDNAEKHPRRNWRLDELRIVGRVLRKFGNVQ